jgi:hypothetical protein
MSEDEALLNKVALRLRLDANAIRALASTREVVLRTSHESDRREADECERLAVEVEQLKHRLRA